MAESDRSDASVEYLLEALANRERRSSILEFIKDFPADARVVLPSLLKILRDDIEHTSSQDLEWALAAAGTSAVVPLSELLQDRRPAVCCCAAMALSKMEGSALPAVPALIRKFDDPNDEVASAAFHAVGEVGPAASAAVAEIIRHLRQKEKPL